MSRFDQDREELIRLIFSICDYARLGYSISTYNSCNNCRASGCEYKPKWGEAVRWNCPLWKGADDRKTENSSEKPNNLSEKPTGSDDTQTYITEDRDTRILDAWQVEQMQTERSSE